MIETPEQMQSRNYNHISFTVHDYLRTLSSLKPEPDALLRNGYSIIKAATAEGTEWNPPTVVIRNVGHNSRNSYVFNGAPPVVISEKERVKELKEWGSPVSQDETFHLRDLQDFVSSNPLYIVQTTTTSLANLSSKRTKSDSPTAEPEPKRRKLNLGSLYHVIPQPHIHPSPFIASDTPLKIKPFKKAEPIFIAPYTVLPTSDIQLGWLIPVRGAFSWENCTSAELLDSSGDLPCSASSGVVNSISWTEDSLLKFWDFLLSLRKIGSLGPLGVSFHVARAKEPSPLTSSLGISRGTAESTLYLSKLNFSDYIKVYHDAPKTLYIRYALDIWQYQGSSDDGHLQKIRLLKGARLVLLDEASQGILTL